MPRGRKGNEVTWLPGEWACRIISEVVIYGQSIPGGRSDRGALKATSGVIVTSIGLPSFDAGRNLHCRTESMALWSKSGRKPFAILTSVEMPSVGMVNLTKTVPSIPSQIAESGYLASTIWMGFGGFIS